MRLPLDSLTKVTGATQLTTLTKHARSALQTASALASTARGAAPALLKEAPHLIGAVGGGALSLGTGLIRRVLPGESFGPEIGEHQAAEVESQRDASLSAHADLPAEPAINEEASEVGAPGSAAAAVDKAVHRVADQVTPGEVLTHDQLPLADFDHLTIGALRTRIRPLDLGALVQLRSYERVHANRLTVITALENRIAKLQADDADSGRPKAVARS